MVAVVVGGGGAGGGAAAAGAVAAAAGAGAAVVAAAAGAAAAAAGAAAAAAAALAAVSAPLARRDSMVDAEWFHHWHDDHYHHCYLSADAATEAHKRVVHRIGNDGHLAFCDECLKKNVKHNTKYTHEYQNCFKQRCKTKHRPRTTTTTTKEAKTRIRCV